MYPDIKADDSFDEKALRRLRIQHSLIDEELLLKIFHLYQNSEKPKPEKEISIQGKSFGIYPSLHFAKLINAVN